MAFTVREKTLSVALAISLILSLGYAIAQSVDPLGDADIVGIFQKLPEGVAPLQFSPQTFNAGFIREGEFQDYTLLVTNPNPFGLNITWTGPQVNATVPIQVRLQLGGVTFSPNTFMAIGPGETLSFTARVRMNACPGCVVGEIPFKASFLFSGVNGSIPSPTVNPGTDGSMMILNAEARVENFTVFWNATFQNESGVAQDFDLIARLQRAGASEVDAFSAMRVSIPPGSSETIQGTLDLPLTAVNGTFWQVQLEALTLPQPGQDGVSFALLIIDEVLVADGIIPPLVPAGEPEGFVPEAIPEAEVIAEPQPQLRTIGGIVPEALFPATILMAVMGVVVVVLVFFARRSKRKSMSQESKTSSP